MLILSNRSNMTQVMYNSKKSHKLHPLTPIHAHTHRTPSNTHTRGHRREPNSSEADVHDDTSRTYTRPTHPITNIKYKKRNSSYTLAISRYSLKHIYI